MCVNMRDNGKRLLTAGVALLAAFILWTILIQCVDVRPAGQNGTNIGFAAFNLWFHRLTGVHMAVYTLTDWLGLVPIAVCLGFGGLGLVQLIQRRSLMKVDQDILLLGAYYTLVVNRYTSFGEMDLGDGQFALLFTLTDGRGETTYADEVIVTVEGEDMTFEVV